ncbi:hypothetical protein [Rahnella ecdela]|uniref:Uncharacterized protein n=1 Tax=Rahnella ecdela TaxID=2816250 RepID=A0ABS6LDY4_9GAMM|nr:hypothetical protein [Rahnella ecdela]MBU9844836.1 hypothetical protein [Rahnella ecdela]
MRSDFSISGEQILDTVLLTAEINGIPVTGMSSFVNIQRQRNVDFSFCDETAGIIHARITYDTPAWDCDHLRVWTINPDGSERILLDRLQEKSIEEFATIDKLSALCRDVYNFVKEGTQPSQPFPDLKTSVRLQETLDYLQENAITHEPARYIRYGKRTLLSRESALEVLG